MLKTWTFCNIHTKARVLESLFNKVAGFHVFNVIKRRLRLRCFPVNHTVNVIKLSPLTDLFCNCPLICNCPLLKYFSFNTKCLLVWCDWPVTTCLVRAIFGINYPRDFWKFWNCVLPQRFQKCTQAIYPKSLSQTCDS